jgi:hypothetical protein
MTPKLMMTKGETDITILTNHIPAHATATEYTEPIQTYITDTDNTYTIPLAPIVAASSSCLTAGVVGVAINGTYIRQLLHNRYL